MNSSKNLIALAVGAAFGGFTSVASGGGFALIEQNASGIGNAYAGQAATAQDASTIYFNPAGMTLLPGRQAVSALHAIKPSAEFTNTGSTTAFTFFGAPPGAALPLGGNGGDAGDWAFVPNAYLSWQLSPRWFVGVGLNAPFGLKTEYDSGWVGRFHGLESEIKTININPSVAFKVNEAVSLGAGFSFQRAQAKLTRATNYAAAASLLLGSGAVPAPLVPAVAAVAANPAQEGTVKLDGNDNSWGYNFGALFSIYKNTRIGIAYRSSVEQRLSGNVSFQGRPAALAPFQPDGPITAEIELPATASWSIFHPINSQRELMGDITWTQWSDVKTVPVIRSNSGATLETLTLNFKDTWRVSAGANYHMNSAWTVRFGVAFDQGAAPDAERTPRIPDEDRTWLALGAQYRMSKQAVVDVGFAHLFIKDPTVNLCPGTASVNPLNTACRGRNNLRGTYESNVNILSAQLRYSF